MMVYCASTGEASTAVFVPSSSGYSFSYAYKSRESSKLETSDEDHVLEGKSVTWRTFRCPWCDAQDNFGTRVVRCGKCKRLTCSGSLKKEAQDSIRHYCVPACGTNDLLSGKIQSYDSSKSNAKGNS